MSTARDYVNIEPIDDPIIVLDLLYKRWADSTSRVLHKSFRGHTRPSYVRVEHLHDFSAGTITDFAVTERVVRHLMDAHQIIGKPRWGYRDEHEFMITSAGETAFADAMERVGGSWDFRCSSEWWFRAVGPGPWVPSPATPRIGTRFQSRSTGALVEVVAVDDTDVHYRFLPSGDESYPLTCEKFVRFFREVQRAEVGEILVIKCACHGPCAHCGHGFNRCLPSRACPKCGHPLNVRFLNCELATPEDPIHEPREP